MENFVWYQHYAPSVPHTIDADMYGSLLDMIDDAIGKYPDKVAFIHLGVKMTFSQLDRLSKQFAAYLQNKTSLKPGDRIALQMPNCIQYPIAMFGALRAGLIIVNVNPLYTPRELEHQLNDASVKAIVILANFGSLLEKVLPHTPSVETVIVTEVGDMLSFPKKFIVNMAVKHVKKLVPPFNIPQAVPFTTALSVGASRYVRPEVNHNDIAFLQYTGGTTGVSKGAMLTHRNIVANMLQIRAWMAGAHLKEGEELVVTALPLYHIFSLTVNCFAFFVNGCANLLITNPRDMKAFIGEMAKYPFTAITGINTLFNGLLHQPDFAKLNFKHLKITVGGGMAVQTTVANRWKNITGVPLCEGYGLTESSPVLTCNPVDGSGQIGSIGIPLPSTEVRIVDDNGNPLPIGERGELWARGPQVMAGYWQRPDETAKTLENGWLKTGDIAVMQPDGYFKIVDRKKEMILVSGFNVYPNEVEDVVATHPKVLEVAAIGVPDPKSTETVKIFVVKKDDSLTEDELREHCNINLTGYKRPKYIEFRSELPKTNVGKILRRTLREEEMQRAAQAQYK